MKMKKLSNYFVYAICIIAVAFSAGAFIKVNANTNIITPKAIFNASAAFSIVYLSFQYKSNIFCYFTK